MGQRKGMDHFPSSLAGGGGGVVPSFNQEFSPSIFTARGCEVSVKRLSSSTGAQVSLLGLGALLAQRCLS